MKYVLLATPIQFKNGLFGTPEFIEHLIASDEQFIKDGEGIRSSFRIAKVIAEHREKKTSYLPLEDHDHARTLRAAEHPTAGYPTPHAVMCHGVLMSIVEAKNDRPEEKPPQETAESSSN